MDENKIKVSSCCYMLYVGIRSNRSRIYVVEGRLIILFLLTKSLRRLKSVHFLQFTHTCYFYLSLVSVPVIPVSSSYYYYHHHYNHHIHITVVGVKFILQSKQGKGSFTSFQLCEANKLNLLNYKKDNSAALYGILQISYQKYQIQAAEEWKFHISNSYTKYYSINSCNGGKYCGFIQGSY
jgi:hypothetical protein